MKSHVHQPKRKEQKRGANVSKCRRQAGLPHHQPNTLEEGKTVELRAVQFSPEGSSSEDVTLGRESERDDSKHVFVLCKDNGRKQRAHIAPLVLKQRERNKTMQVKIEVIEGTVHVVGPYSTENNDVWRSLGGKFTGGRWVLPDNETVRKKIAEMFGAKSEEVEVFVPNEKLTDDNIVQIGGSSPLKDGGDAAWKYLAGFLWRRIFPVRQHETPASGQEQRLPSEVPQELRRANGLNWLSKGTNRDMRGQHNNMQKHKQKHRFHPRHLVRNCFADGRNADLWPKAGIRHTWVDAYGSH